VLTHPGWKEFSRVEVGTDVSPLVEVTEVGLECKTSEEKALLLTHGLVVMQQVVPQLQVVLQSRRLLPEHHTFSLTLINWPDRNHNSGERTHMLCVHTGTHLLQQCQIYPQPNVSLLFHRLDISIPHMKVLTLNLFHFIHNYYYYHYHYHYYYRFTAIMQHNLH